MTNQWRAAASPLRMLKRIKDVLGRIPFLPAPSTGERGERLAAAFLEKQRHAIVVRNWRDPKDRRDEIDLITMDGTVLVFVEVKTRSAAALVRGYEAVDARKKRVVLRAAKSYLRGLGSAPETFRFDIVEVIIPEGGGAPKVLHFENVELFPKHFRP